jgi:hypothetical protein
LSVAQGVKVLEEFNQCLHDRILAQLEYTIGEALSVESVLRSENEYLMQVLRDNGIDPWALPEQE